MRVQYRITSFPKIRRKFRYIVLHDTTCMYTNVGFSKIDDNKSKISKLRSYSFIFKKQYDLNYHFLCEYINNDYETCAGRPLNRLCEYSDMPDIYQNGLHVCVFGDFNIIEGKQRMYQQVGYRVIAPMMHWFGISLSRVVLHNQISNDKEIKCPGDKFDYNKLINNLKLYIMK